MYVNWFYMGLLPVVQLMEVVARLGDDMKSAMVGCELKYKGRVVCNWWVTEMQRTRENRSELVAVIGNDQMDGFGQWWMDWAWQLSVGSRCGVPSAHINT